MVPEADGERELQRRLHPATLLFEVGRRFATLVFWCVAVVVFAARSQELGYLVFLLPPLLNSVVRYVSFRYAFTRDHLVIRSGVFTRSVRHVPYAHVHNIDTVQGPLHRLLSVVEVRLETASGSEPEAVFRVISLAHLAELRARVFGPSGGERAPEPAGPAAEPAFFRMRARDIALYGLLTQRGLVLVGGGLIALRELASWQLIEERLAPELERVGEGARHLGPLAWIALGMLALLVLQLGSLAWAFSTLYGFRLERVGDDLRTTCGLLTRQTASLPRPRIQLLEVRQGLLQRWLGRVAVRALSAGGDSTGESQVARKWLVPLCAQRELAPILAEVQPAADFTAVTWRAPHARARRRMFVRALLRLAPLAQLGWFHSPALALGASLAAALLAFLHARARAKNLAWGASDEAVFVRDGVLTRRLTCVRFEKIQAVILARSPFDRRAGTARIALDTAGAGGGELRLVLPFLALRDAARLAARLQREAAALDFRW